MSAFQSSHGLCLRKVLPVCALIGLVGCTVAPLAAPSPQTTPEPRSAVVTPLPVTVIPELASPLPVPEAERGLVTGQVFNLAGDRPVANTPVYLGLVTRTPDGGGMFTVEPNTSPRGLTDEEGRFTIRDVPAGEYVLVVGALGSIRTPSVVMQSQTQVRAFTVQPGTVTDLGLVRVDYLDR
ncbi:MAG: carboxypeptidase-like regulatory domain-containing protein [Anaerolineae bacterium]|nr:carboxypeptidase-like regulatory domain-containing protein [Anaerolineae bacterium]